MPSFFGGDAGGSFEQQGVPNGGPPAASDLFGAAPPAASDLFGGGAPAASELFGGGAPASSELSGGPQQDQSRYGNEAAPPQQESPQQMYAEQLSLYTYGRAWANESDPAPLVGHFFWTLRMGSGWDPRPTAAHPHGRQIGSSSASRSLSGYPFRVWSLLELAANHIATPMSEPDSRACEGVPNGL